MSEPTSIQSRTRSQEVVDVQGNLRDNWFEVDLKTGTYNYKCIASRRKFFKNLVIISIEIYLMFFFDFRKLFLNAKEPFI